jgi:hypothetical protein
MNNNEIIKLYEEKILNTQNSGDRKREFYVLIELLNNNFAADFWVSGKFNEFVNKALNLARLYIDELINCGDFAKAKDFSYDAEIQLKESKAVLAHVNKDMIGEIGNFFEMFNYRILDREYISQAKDRIEKSEKKNESRTYETLTVFIAIISIIFSFSQKSDTQSVVTFYGKSHPDFSFIYLALTIVGSFILIKMVYLIIDWLTEYSKNKK